MSDLSIALNIIVILGLMFYALRTRNMSNKQSIKSNNQPPFRLYEAEERDPSLRHYRRGNFITSHPEDTDRLGEAYDKESWRFMMPHTATDLLIECFSGDERKAYQIKRAIELSIEHLMIEMADDAEALRIVDERLNENSTVSLNLEEYKRYRSERIMDGEKYESVGEWRARTQSS